MRRTKGFSLTRAESFSVLKMEINHLESWFDKYDRLIFQLRGWLSTIFVAVLGFIINKKQANLADLLLILAIFSLSVEMIWRWQYWTKRSVRYDQIKEDLHNKGKLKLYDRSLSDDIWERLKKLVRYILEPTFFYFCLIIGSVIVRTLISRNP